MLLQTLCIHIILFLDLKYNVHNSELKPKYNMQIKDPNIYILYK